MSAKPFEIGIVMSGAAMAGAYTAGVVDFLVEALDEWEKSRAQPDVPRHRVQLRVMTGASAGSLVTAASTWMMLDGQAPTRSSPADGASNALHASWVERGGLEDLLGTRDLPDDESPLASLFDGYGIEAMASRALGRDRSTKIDLGAGLRARPWIHPALEIAMTTSSLRGIPYAASYEGGALHMRTCADHARFVLGPRDEARARDGAITLDPHDASSAGWEQLVRATLASCAVPMALPSRYLETPRRFYDDRIAVPGEPHAFVAPAWPEKMSDPYGSLYIDGGLFENAPLDLAHRVLAGGRGLRNARDPKLATRALVLIDPCPGFAAGEYALEAPRTPDMLRDLLAFGLAVVYQPRFQPEDVALARSDRVASRFMIVPTRKGHDGARFPLASTPIGAFAGAFHRSFREHDFFLGRRNCQQFLKRWLALDPDNALFEDGTSAHDVTWTCEDGARVPKRPIIPLVGTARQEVRQPGWPSVETAALRRALEGPFRQRLARVVRALAHRTSFTPARLFAARLPSQWTAAPIASRVLDTCLAQLREARLTH